MKRLILVGLLVGLLAACGGRYTVPPEKELPNPNIGGRVFGPVQP